MPESPTQEHEGGHDDESPKETAKESSTSPMSSTSAAFQIGAPIQEVNGDSVASLKPESPAQEHEGSYDDESPKESAEESPPSAMSSIESLAHALVPALRR